MVLVGQCAPVLLDELAQRLLGPVAGVGRQDQILQRHDQRWVGDEAGVTVDHSGQLLEGAGAVAGPGLGHVDHGLVPVLPVPSPIVVLGADPLAHLGHVHVRVPDVERAPVGCVAQCLAVGAGGGQDHPPAIGGREAPIASGDLEAGHQPLHVPLPGAGQRLVEVVDVEDQTAFGRSEHAEVGEMGITTALHGDG